MENKQITIKQLREEFLDNYKSTLGMTPIGDGWFSTCEETPEEGSIFKTLETNPTVKVKDRGIIREGVILSATYEKLTDSIVYDVLFPVITMTIEEMSFLDQLGCISLKNIEVVDGTSIEVTDKPKLSK